MYFLGIASQCVTALPARFENGVLIVDCAQVPELPDYKLQLTYVGGTEYEFTLTDAEEVSGIAPRACAGNFNALTSELTISRVKVGTDQYDVTLRFIESSSPPRFELVGGTKLSINPDNFSLVAGNWEFTQTAPWDNSPFFVNDIPVMDVNRDGLDDVVIMGPLLINGNWVDQTVPITWLKNIGDGTFEPGDSSIFPDSSALTHVRHTRVADFNNDGIDDLAAVSHGYDVQPFPNERNILLLSDLGSSYQDVSAGDPNFDYLGFTHAMDVGDVNGDNVPDLVTLDLIGTPNPDSALRILINDGNGNFTRDSTAIELNGLTGRLNIDLADLNGDGADEIVFGSWNEGKKSQVFWNDGTGHFDSINYSTLPEFNSGGENLYDTLAIASVDLNLDGVMDLILSRSATYSGRGIQFLINNSDKTFTDVTDVYSPWLTGNTISSGTVPYYLNLIDFNGDGLDDLLLGYDSDYDANGSFLWLRNSDGTFREYPGSNLSFTGVMWPLDYDLDGDMDLVVRNSCSSVCEENPYWRVLENKLIDAP